MKLNFLWKGLLFFLMSFVIFAGISFPLVQNVTEWYQFPNIPGLGDQARIIFFHVPASWLATLSFLVAMIFGIKYLRSNNLDDDAKSLAALQIGMMFVVLATVTGSLWAKFAWGTFWNWDPRETSIFVLLLIYGSLFALRSSIEDVEKRAKLSAVYSVIAFITVPFFIFIMPRIMAGLHPGSANDNTAGPVLDFNMNGNMQLIFFLSLIAFTILYFWIWKLTYKSIIIKEKLSGKYI
jgi:heme exporter protein C